MSSTERERRDLYEGLEAALGPERSETLMALLPLQPADELVTISYFQTEMGALRAELKGEMAELRGEMAELRAELRGEMADLKLTTQRWMSGAMATNTVALVVALVT